MSKKIIIKNFAFRRKKIKKITVSQEIEKGEKVLSVFFVAMIISMSLMYIFQMSSVATNGYEVDKYEKKLANLKNENQDMTIKLADLKAMNNFENNNSEFIAIKYSNIAYITSNSEEVAIQK